MLQLLKPHKYATLIVFIPLILLEFFDRLFVIENIKLLPPDTLPFLSKGIHIAELDITFLLILPVFLIAVLISQAILLHSHNKSIQHDDTEGGIEGLDKLNHEVLPIWCRQIASVRNQADVAVTDLAIQFKGITKRINASIDASVKYSNDGVSHIGNRVADSSGMITQEELAEMLDTLREAIDVKAILLDKISQLKEQTNVMTDVVLSVKSISRKTEVLAINASIESRRAGVHGLSFGIIAQEVRKLSEQSEEMVDDVAQRIQLLEEKMDEVIAQTDLNTLGPDNSSDNKQSNISIYERFRKLALSLSKSSEILLLESGNIRDEIYNIIVALQYQDKTSQILVHITDNIQDLYQRIDTYNSSGNREIINPEEWINKLRSTYTMVEEVYAHDGVDIDYKSTEIDGNSSLEYF